MLTRFQAVQSGQQIILADVVGLLGGTGSAALEVVSDQPLKVSSRTYNLVAGSAACYPGGTFGQSYDAFPSRGSASASRLAHPAYRERCLPHQHRPHQHRHDAAKVAVNLFDGAGGQVGSYTVDLNPGQYKQENRPFSTKAGQTNLARGYARVTVTEGHGVIASASVIDNLTNDPTTMPMHRTASPATTSWVQVGSHAPGANQSQWRTDLGVLNPSTQSASRAGAVPQERRDQQHRLVAAGAAGDPVDVVNQIPETGSAALEIVSDRPVVMSSRTYNQVAAGAACYPNGTFGQNYDAFTTSRALGTGSGRRTCRSCRKARRTGPTSPSPTPAARWPRSP